MERGDLAAWHSREESEDREDRPNGDAPCTGKPPDTNLCNRVVSGEDCSLHLQARINPVESGRIAPGSSLDNGTCGYLLRRGVGSWDEAVRTSDDTGSIIHMGFDYESHDAELECSKQPLVMRRRDN